MNNPNPPAFPNINLHTKEGIEVYGDSGMTLRDYFAAKAMQVILESQYLDGIYVGDQDNDSEYDCAGSAYQMADAMLKVRET